MQITGGYKKEKSFNPVYLSFKLHWLCFKTCRRQKEHSCVVWVYLNNNIKTLLALQTTDEFRLRWDDKEKVFDGWNFNGLTLLHMNLPEMVTKWFIEKTRHKRLNGDHGKVFYLLSSAFNKLSICLNSALLISTVSTITTIYMNVYLVSTGLVRSSKTFFFSF